MGLASRVWLMLFAHSLLFPVSLLGVTLPERPPRPVVDLASIVETDMEKRIDSLLRELQQKTGVQMVILTVETLEGTPIEDFSLHVAHDLWRLGQKGKDNGLLLTVAIRERVYRFEVGYGLEDILPDGLVGSIGRRYLVPSFRKGAYGEGLWLVTLSIAKIVASHYGAELRTAQPSRRNLSLGQALLLIFLSALFLFSLFGPSRRRLFGPWVFLPGPYSPYGWGGTGFGGFGGGGGGFGGAGAQGRW